MKTAPSGALCSQACTQVHVLPLASWLSLLVTFPGIRHLLPGALFPFVCAWLEDAFEFQELVSVYHCYFFSLTDPSSALWRTKTDSTLGSSIKYHPSAMRWWISSRIFMLLRWVGTQISPPGIRSRHLLDVHLPPFHPKPLCRYQWLWQICTHWPISEVLFNVFLIPRLLLIDVECDFCFLVIEVRCIASSCVSKNCCIRSLSCVERASLFWRTISVSLCS